MSGRKHSFTVELALLGLLRQHSMHPYELHQRLLQSEPLGVGNWPPSWLDRCVDLLTPMPA
ncbi:MAG TPA: hypothetical protein VNL77_04120 [Roseiflexaceae bacterium]|nr:hypothetical protein [Roseiflexaceae bacterium]